MKGLLLDCKLSLNEKKQPAVLKPNLTAVFLQLLKTHILEKKNKNVSSKIIFMKIDHILIIPSSSCTDQKGSIPFVYFVLFAL